MRNIWTIARREYSHYFISPAAYGVAFMFLVVLGVIFYANILAATYQQYAPGAQLVMGPLVTLLLFSTPAITMRTLAEEQKMGTLELLLTYPVRDWELVVGKFLGAFMFLLSLIAITLLYPLVLNQMIEPGIDQGLLISGYLGIILMAAAFIAIGVAVSSLFANQIAAFFSTLAALLIITMISFPAQAMGGAGSELLTYLDMSEHFYNTFYIGIIEIKDVVYFLSVIATALFFGSVIIETRRWR
jgi:ABC-2 type transport system permease protein